MSACWRALALAAAVAGAVALPAAAQAPAAEQARNLALVGRHDLHGRSAYQPVIQRQGARWYAYVGLHGGAAVNPLTGRSESNGTLILDVTDPRAPRLVAHVPGTGGGAQMVRVCAGLPRAPGRVLMLRTAGHTAHEVWDVTDPARPARVSVVADDLTDTHKNWWECDTGIAYLVSGVPGWRSSRVMQVFDLSDPARPVFVRTFGLPGQQPGATGPVPAGLHGPISTGPAGNRVYLGYGVNREGVLQILDRDRLLRGPREPTERNLLFPQVGRLDLPRSLGAHTAFPIPGVEVPAFAADGEGWARDLVLVVNEAVSHGCREARQMAWLVDVTDEARPWPLAGYTPDEASGGFCARGRFGAHASNGSFAAVYYRRVVFIAHFNAGVRAVDIRDPMAPREIGHYIPAAPGGAVLTNNVEVDERGYVYIVDRGGLGLHVLEPTGALRAAARLP